MNKLLIKYLLVRKKDFGEDISIYGITTLFLRRLMQVILKELKPFMKEH
jgi:hypothetical protein